MRQTNGAGVGKIVREMIDRGVTAIWLPVFNHAITLSTVGTYRRVIDGTMPTAGTDPCLGTKLLRWDTMIWTPTAS